ncbi:TldD/PmbA family protein [Myxococcota bacterium]|nr:TldD/PmbA family protein [Myxococcota bacterium]MBU1430015.1 TldD/PmbA family protein [Myxococcota bacterium]MBU1899854.1 TldD/PmbA family protein [Myxococcota bacterium]
MNYFEPFGVDEALLKLGLERALSRGADWAELFFEHRVSQQVGLEDGAVDRAYLGVTLGVGVRVVKGDQTGYAYSEEISRAALSAAATTAAVIADGPARPAPIAFNATPLPNRYPTARPWAEVDLSEKMPILQRLNEQAFAADPRIAKVRVGLSHSQGAVLIVDSTGRVSFDLQPMGRLNIGCTAIDGARRESNGANYAARGGFELFSPQRLELLSSEAVERTLFLFDARPAPAGAMPIVLGAGASGILLHEAIGHGMEADFNRKGVSVYSEQLNQRIASEHITIVDDGTRLGDRGAINVDDEGAEGQRTTLVEQGILRTYMHDRISAEHYGVAPTGNGRRESFRHPPLPRMRSTYMLPGPHDPAEIIASVKRGVYAETFTNGQVMIGAGDFTFYIKTGYLIEDGKLTQPIKDTNIIGNGPEVLRQTDMVGTDFKFDDGGWVCGKDGQSVPVSLGMPTVRVSSITIGGVN